MASVPPTSPATQSPSSDDPSGSPPSGSAKDGGLEDAAKALASYIEKAAQDVENNAP